MQRKFITNLSLLLLLNLLIKPFWILGIDRSVQNVVGAEEYGLYYALFNFSFLLNILLDVGITNFNNKNIAQNNQLVTKHFSSIAVLKLMLGGAYIVFTLLAGWVVGYTFEHPEILALLVLNQFLISFIMYLRSNLAGLHLFKTDSLISVLDRAIMIVICGFLLWGNVMERQFQIEWFVYAQTGSYVVTAIVAFVLVLSRAGHFRPKWDRPFFMMILKQSFPFAVLILLMTFYNRVDSVMVERMLDNGAQQAGVYAQGYRLLDAANMVAFLFSGLLLPMFAKMVKQKESVEPLVNLSSRLLISLSITVAIISWLFQTELMELLYEEHTVQSAPLFGILMICFIPVASSYIFGTLLTANGNLKALNIMAGTGMVLNIVLNLVLIPRLWAYGAAIASLITQFITAAIQIILVQYIFRFKVNYTLFFRWLLFAAGILMAGYGAQMLAYDWPVKLAGVTVFSAVWAFVINVVSVKALYRILKYDTTAS